MSEITITEGIAQQAHKGLRSLVDAVEKMLHTAATYDIANAPPFAWLRYHRSGSTEMGGVKNITDTLQEEIDAPIQETQVPLYSKGYAGLFIYYNYLENPRIAQKLHDMWIELGKSARREEITDAVLAFAKARDSEEKRNQSVAQRIQSFVQTIEYAYERAMYNAQLERRNEVTPQDIEKIILGMYPHPIQKPGNTQRYAA